VLDPEGNDTFDFLKLLGHLVKGLGRILSSVHFLVQSAVLLLVPLLYQVTVFSRSVLPSWRYQWLTIQEGESGDSH